MELQFSRGTLILRDVEHSQTENLPRGFFWDTRINQYRASAIHYRRVLAFFLQNGTPLNDCVSPDQLKITELWSPVSLYPHQQAAAAAWEDSGMKGVIVLPTGGGKTRVALDLMERHNCSTLVLVPTRALLAQWTASLQAFYHGPIGILGDGHYQIESITISTYESAYRRMSALGSQFRLMVLDEVHHFGTGQRDEILRMSAAPWRLGLTASLPKDDEHLRKITALVGPLVYEATIGDLKGAYLADFDHLKLRMGLTAQELDTYTLNYAKYQFFSNSTRWCWQDIGWQAFCTYASRTDAGRDAMNSLRIARACVGVCESKLKTLQTILRRHWQERVFIFVSSTADVCRIAEMMLAYPIVADVKRPERDLVLQKFKEGKIRAIVSCKVLNEGIDVPSASVAVILGGTSQEREQIQRIGRVLRKHPDKRAIVYELIAAKTFEVGRSTLRNAHVN